ncbi:MAG TPA: acyl carrier protein [Candidatus Saccharimonadales bacterium]|nr:acyl carrier protein [Candidatus Saccharimonadales bacterium]
MIQGGPEGGVTREAIVADLVALISDMTQDWDLGFSGGIHEETGLVSDLGFQSIDVVMLVGEIHKHYGQRNLPFEKVLLVDGRYAEEIRVSDLADFLHVQLNVNGSGAPTMPAGGPGGTSG